MNRLTKNSGFTLIEILVVLIIVGVLAAIALPNLFANVARSKAHEALTSLSAYKTAVEACLDANCNNQEYTKCIGMDDNFLPTPNFTYHWQTDPTNQAAGCTANGTSSTTAAIFAVGNTAQGFAADGSDTITLTRANFSGMPWGTWRCTGAGKFQGVC